MEDYTSPSTEPTLNISLDQKSHRHSYADGGTYLVCECGHKILNLKQSSTPGILEGIKSNGVKYTVRTDRHRYLYPDEWAAFEKTLKKDSPQMFLFLSLLHTGARIMEGLHFKPSSFDFDRNSVSFTVVKKRTAKKRYGASKRARSFFVNKDFCKRLKGYINRHNIGEDDYIFLPNHKLPVDYDTMENKDKKRYYGTTKAAYSAMIKRKLILSGIKNPEELSLHNIRKTYGNWMRALNIEAGELCFRMGHDMETFMEHYGSALLFTPDERRDISKIMGNTQ